MDISCFPHMQTLLKATIDFYFFFFSSFCVTVNDCQHLPAQIESINHTAVENECVNDKVHRYWITSIIWIISVLTRWIRVVRSPLDAMELVTMRFMLFEHCRQLHFSFLIQWKDWVLTKKNHIKKATNQRISNAVQPIRNSYDLNKKKRALPSHEKNHM